MQAADVKMGAVNIRSEEGVTPEAVLAGFSRAEQEEVRSLLLDRCTASDSDIMAHLCNSHCMVRMCMYLNTQAPKAA